MKLFATTAFAAAAAYPALAGVSAPAAGGVTDWKPDLEIKQMFTHEDKELHCPDRTLTVR
jgi:hypothetical protein